MQDVLKRLLCIELKNLPELHCLGTFDDEDWVKAMKSILNQFDYVMHELAK